MRVVRLAAAMTCLIASVAAAPAQRTLVVDLSGGGDYTRIQDAVNAAHNGDTVLLRPGVYDQYVRVRRKNITLRSVDPLDQSVVASTIIDARTYQFVQRSLWIEMDSHCVVAGLTFVNAATDARMTNGNGASTLVVASEVEFRNNLWRDNHSLGTSASGSALYGSGATLRLYDNSFVDNESAFSGSAMGMDQSTADIRRNTFVGNETHNPDFPVSGAFVLRHIQGGSLTFAHNYVEGEGMMIENVEQIIVEHNVFIHTRGLRMIFTPEGVNTIVQNNLLVGSGSGTAVSGGPVLAAQSNTIVGMLFGVAVGESTVTLQNNLVAESHFGLYHSGYANTTILANDNCWDNLEYDLYRYPLGGFTIPNNLYTNPGVVTPGTWDFNGTPIGDDDTYTPGDIHLTRSSPCINAGDPYWPADPAARDLDGQVRLAGGRADIGVDEYPAIGDLDGDGSFTNFDIDAFVLALTDAAAHAAAYPLADAALAGDVNGDGRFDNFDIDAFVTCIIAGGCP